MAERRKSKYRDVRSLPTAGELRPHFHYDLETGLLYRKFKSSPMRRVGRENNHGYLLCKFNCQIFAVHRIIWLVETGSWPTAEIDHINGIKTDNRMSNLRDCTSSQNAAYSKPNARNTTGFRGVYKCKKRWKAQMQVRKQTIYLGVFGTKEEAHEAYRLACIKHHRDFSPFHRPDVDHATNQGLNHG